MPFTITITESKSHSKMSREWVAKETAMRDGNSKTSYDYGPEIEKIITSEDRIYEQKVDELDLAAVIKAINGI